MTANLERVRAFLERVERIGGYPLHLEARDLLALLSPAQPPPEPAPRLSDERIRELVDEGAENGRRMAEAAKSMRPLAPPEPAPADWAQLARNAGWVSPEEQALAIRDATAPAVQLRGDIEPAAHILRHVIRHAKGECSCGVNHQMPTDTVQRASDALAKLRPAKGGDGA